MIVVHVEDLIKKEVGEQALGCWKGNFILISRDWLTLRGAVPPESARLQQSKHQNIGHRGHDEYKGAARDLRMHLHHFIDEKTEPQRGKCAQGQLENHALKSISVS